VIAYNGEIFNYRELRASLAAEGIHCRGESDTEVLLEGCAHWGVAPTVARLIGMFAFALWDKATRSLTLVRDRLGVKPLYYSEQEQRFLFGSEMKALVAAARWSPELDPDALASYLRFGYVPAPLSIFRQVAKLPPGCILTVTRGRPASIAAYWQ